VAVSKRLRFEILRRDNHACRYCGASAPEAELVVDHVLAVALGGTDEPGNLVAACQPCNSGKSATPVDAPLVDDVQADALRWAKAMEQATKIARQSADKRRHRRVIFADRIWDQWTYEYPKGQHNTFELPADWEDTIDRFCEFGISDEEFHEAVNIAMTRRNRDPFRYMCAILWRWIDERREIATEIVRGDEAGNGA
jgi:hypothetical protein